MKYEEFSDLKEVELKETKLVKCFELSSKERFFIEPPFYTQLMSLKEIYPDENILVYYNICFLFPYLPTKLP